MTLLALLDVPETTLLGVLRMLVDENYRGHIVARCATRSCASTGRESSLPTGPSFAAEVVAPVQNKVAAVLSYPALRLIFGQARSTFHPRVLMDEGRIVVANLGQGSPRRDASAFLGAVLATSFQLAAYARADVSEHARPAVLTRDG